MKPFSFLSSVALYGAGFLQGSAFVLIPALGNLLSLPPYHFSASAYGLLFLPQTAGAILGATAAGSIQRRFGMIRLYRLGLLCNIIALLLLYGASTHPGQLSYPLILADSLFMGLGFGWTVAAINHYSAHFFSARSSMAITLLNAVIGGATALSPLLLHALTEQGHWGTWPLILAIGWILITLIHLPQILADPQSIFWPRSLSPFFLMVLVYALCEGSFGSWASVYLHTTAHPGSQAGTLALSAFWGSMTCFRLLLAPLPETWLSRRKLLLLSATGIAACFILIPLSSSTGVLIALFACAGAACSIYYPFTMALSLARFPEENTQVAGLLVAALMMGEGIGSYGIGWLQAFFSLKSLYLASAVWGIFLFIGAWYMTRAQRSTSPLSK